MPASFPACFGDCRRPGTVPTQVSADKASIFRQGNLDLELVEQEFVIMPDFPGLPIELSLEMLERKLDTRRAIIVRKDGYMAYDLQPSLLGVSKDYWENLVGSWDKNRFVRIAYKGSNDLRPSAFIPITTDDIHAIFTQPEHVRGPPWVADVDIYHDRTQQERQDEEIPVTLGCVTTEDAACLWLAILSARQHSDHRRLLVKAFLSGETKLCQVLRFLDSRQTTLSVGIYPDELQELTANELVWSRQGHTDWLLRSQIYGHWIHSTTAQGRLLSILDNKSAQPDFCAFLCKQVITMRNQGSPEDQQAIAIAVMLAELLNWAYEYHQNRADEGSLETLRMCEAGCDRPGCPCLGLAVLEIHELPCEWSKLQMVVPNGEDLWIELCRYSLALHHLHGTNQDDGTITQESFVRMLEGLGRLLEMAPLVYRESLQKDKDLLELERRGEATTSTLDGDIDAGDGMDEWEKCWRRSTFLTEHVDKRCWWVASSTGVWYTTSKRELRESIATNETDFFTRAQLHGYLNGNVMPNQHAGE